MAAYSLPAGLRAAADALVAGRGQALREGAAALSEAYRAGARSSETMDFAAYLVTRMPATYAAIAAVFGELDRRLPDFAPQSLADIGSGPGTASWAAVERWPGLGDVTFVDNNRAFLDLAMRLACGHHVLAGARAVLASANHSPATADLTVAAYALAEMPESEAGRIAAHLWRGTHGVLVIVEPGTPAGFARVRRARDALVAAGAAIAAPCPHAGACPMARGDWCHFSVRLPRSRLHMRAKGARVPFEDERFSYVIATRHALSQSAPRILAPPEVGKAGVRLKLCTAAGVATPVIARRDAATYKRARKCAWGETF